MEQQQLKERAIFDPHQTSKKAQLN